MARAPADAQFAYTRILVSDFARSWRFYRDTLGLVPVKGHGAPPYGEFRSDSGAQVALFDRAFMADSLGLHPGRYNAKFTGRSLVVFSTRDLDAFARRLRRRRVRLLRGPTDRPAWMLRTIHLRDPDGYLLEVFSRLPSPSRA